VLSLFYPGLLKQLFDILNAATNNPTVCAIAGK
jgi:hypothetical protein